MWSWALSITVPSFLNLSAMHVFPSSRVSRPHRANEFFSSAAKLDTVKALYNNHPRDPVALVLRWQLGDQVLNLSITLVCWDLGLVVIGRWSLFRGGGC